MDNSKSNLVSSMNECLAQPKDIVTTGQFITMIIEAIRDIIKPRGDYCTSGYMDYALNKGIIEDYDIGNWDYPIERRAAARIAHETLLIELGEKDEKEWSAANSLQDLYICRTCVIHIAQMYVKGIMLGRDNSMFDVRGGISYAEAESIIERLIDREKRIPQNEGREHKVQELTPEEAWELVLNDNRAMIIDVRTLDEYKSGHIDGSICIPLHDLAKNPFSVCECRDTPIILYCLKGYKSSIAAFTLIDVGYSRVYTIPGIIQYEYKTSN